MAGYSEISEDGAYYAIKGYLYQFDKTLIDVLSDPGKQFTVEGAQDLDCEKYVLQVKHKETQDYAHSKIRSAVKKLVDVSLRSPGKNLCLYCHFRDRDPEMWDLTMEDLVKVLGKKNVVRYDADVRQSFLGRFSIQFSPDYESQFEKNHRSD